MKSLSVAITVRPQFLDWQNGTHARLSSLGEGWSQTGSWYRKSGSILRGKTNKPIKLSAKMMQCALEYMFSSPSGWFRIDIEDKESYKVMSVRSRRRKCDVCGAKPQRGKDLCEGCAKLPEGARAVVSAAEPILVLDVDDKYRWISGTVTLATA